MAASTHSTSPSGSQPGLPEGKLNSVQGLRALAVLLVVWTHAIVAAGYNSTPRQATFFHLKGFGAAGLDIFFVISGFIVSLVAARAAQHGPTSAGRFLSRRITRIYPLYWLLTLVVIAEAELGRHPLDWHRVPWIPTLFLLPPWHYPVPPLILSLGWSLLFEMYFYLVLAFWMRWTPRQLIRNSMIFFLAIVGIGQVLGLRRPLLVIWSNPVALEFVFGCLIGQFYSRLSLRQFTPPQSVPSPPLGAKPAPRAQFLPRTRFLGAVLALLGGAALLATIFTGYGMASEASSIMAGLDGWLRLGLWGVPSALLVLGGLLWNPAMQTLPARLLVFLGDASYSIYLCTNPSRSLVEHYWRIFGRWGGDIGVLLCGLVCVLAGIACYLAVERPMMRFFHNWYKPVPL